LNPTCINGSQLIASTVCGSTLTYAAFTHNGFDDQEQNLTFVKTAFQVLKLKSLGCMKQALYPIHKQNIVRA